MGQRAPGAASASTPSADEWTNVEDSTALNYGRVILHVLQKGFQAGGVIGLGVVTPILVFRHARKGGSLPDAVPKVAAALCRTALITTAVSGALCVAKLSREEDLAAGVQDRAYRLHYNASQSRTDLFANAGALAGTAAAAVMLPPSAAVLVGSAAAGAACGVLAHLATASRTSI